ncbi:MAG: PBECR4 domain-containing protein [Clostridia bacterium]|nr:PBECR4 domain-containing protein [Clostridia bacterium]
MHLTGLIPKESDEGNNEEVNSIEDEIEDVKTDEIEDVENEVESSVDKVENDDINQAVDDSGDVESTDNKPFMTAERFYSACLSHKLGKDDFVLNDIQTTSMKLDVIESVINKNLSAKMIGTYNNTATLLETDKIVGNYRACIGFVVDTIEGVYVPNTLLNVDARSYVMDDWTTIIAIYRKKITDKKYSEIVYFAKKNKKILWDKIHYSDEYAYLPKPAK